MVLTWPQNRQRAFRIFSQFLLHNLVTYLYNWCALCKWFLTPEVFPPVVGTLTPQILQMASRLDNLWQYLQTKDLDSLRPSDGIKDLDWSLSNVTMLKTLFTARKSEKVFIAPSPMLMCHWSVSWTKHIDFTREKLLEDYQRRKRLCQKKRVLHSYRVLSYLHHSFSGLHKKVTWNHKIRECLKSFSCIFQYYT